MKMLNIILAILLIAVLIILFLYVGQILLNRSNGVPPKFSNTVEVSIKGQTYHLELSDTNESRRVGLMNRESLPANGGMLFVFNHNRIYPFWMKNTLIPLDIIWLNEDKKVVHIKENAQPCESFTKAVCNSAVPKSISKYVIELNAGEVEQLELEVGDSVSFEID